MGYENIKKRKRRKRERKKKLYKWGVWVTGLTIGSSPLLSSRTDESAPRWTTAAPGMPS